MKTIALLVVTVVAATCPGEPPYCVRLTVTSDLPSGNVPIDPTIDFKKIIANQRLPGRLDPNSITILNGATGKTVPFARTEEFAYGDRGRLEWVITYPSHKTFEIRFRTARERPPLEPQVYTPQVGVGDLLRYNAGAPRPITMPYPARLVDLTGDGKNDFVGCWNYAYRPGWPWDGIICYPRVGDAEAFEFGDLIRVRHVSQSESTDFKHFSRIYMTADFADFNGDNLTDLVYCPSGSDQLFFYLNSGKRDTGGMPVFVDNGTTSRQTNEWNPCRAVDLDRDGAVDFVVGNLYLRNTNPMGWPVKLAKGVSLDVGKIPCFYDVDGDKRLDAVGLEDIPGQGLSNHVVAWRRNLGGDIPEFDPPIVLGGIDIPFPRRVAAVRDGHRRGLLVTHHHYERLSFFQQTNAANSPPRFERVDPIESVSAVVGLSDQAWPCLCDWDGDGDLDVLVGGGYGRPRILINEGSNERMALSESRYILSEGEPIRLTRDEILGGEHWHDMGYPYPVYTDWDSDGLPDLLLPNETNRIFWYKNIGTRTKPKFGPRRQILCDGYTDSPESRTRSALRAADKNSNNGCYPYEAEQPFFWRTGAAFADWNGDSLMDFITHDGHSRKATLFVQYRDAENGLRLKKDRQVKLVDGRLIDDSIVGRAQHWTESFRAVDWNEDGLIDLVYSCAGSGGDSSIYLLRNAGTKTSPKFVPPRTLCCYGQPIKITNHGPHPWIGDLDGDGKSDILACVEWSVYPFFSHNTVEMESRPEWTLSIVESVK